MSSGKRFSSIKELTELFQNKGSKILALIDTDGTEGLLDKVPTTKSKVKWVCANNPSHIQISNLGTIMSKNRDFYVCRSCGISKSKGGPSYESFVELLATDGWEIISPKDKYTNNKSIVKVVCNNGHSTETSQNRYSAGHGCKTCATSRQRRRCIEDVSKEFKERGFVLLATTYTNNSIPLEYLCKCGREGKISYSNFIRNIDGCRTCTRRWIYSEVEDFCDERGCTLVNVDGSETEFVLNSSKICFVCFCGNKHTTTWRRFKNGTRCPECTKESIRATCSMMYGVDNPFKSEVIKEKIKKTMKERYGEEYAMQIKEFSDMARDTNIKNHGVHNLTLPSVRMLSEETYEKKYGGKFGFVEEHQKKAREETKKKLGVDYPLQSKVIQTKVKQNNLKKYGNEVYIVSDTGKRQMEEEYGSEYYVTSDHCKSRMKEEYGSEYYVTSNHYTRTMIDKYGVPHPMQNPELLSKALHTAFSSKDYIAPSGNIWRIQGYEHFALRDILDSGICEDDIIVGCARITPTPIEYSLDGKNHVYFPDIYIKSLNLMIEIKSAYTYQRDEAKNIAKFQAASKLFNFELWVYNSKGERVIQRPFVDTELIFVEC